jgi:hypothetical protein
MSGFIGTTREKVLEPYKKLAAQGQSFLLRTLPYHSTASLEFDVVHGDVAAGVAYAVAERNQELTFFNYASGDRVNLSGDNGHKASFVDTNLSRPKSTNGANDYVIERVGLHCRGHKLQWLSTTGFYPSAQTVDPNVQAALTGINPFFDPTSIASPPELYNPFYLEQAFMSAVVPHMSLEFLFDQSGTRHIGGAWLLGQGGASSYLRANGEPTRQSTFFVPEGYLWARDGEPDSDFVAYLRNDAPLTIPISGIMPPYAGTMVFPAHIWLEVVLTVWGLEIGLPSSN